MPKIKIAGNIFLRSPRHIEGFGANDDGDDLNFILYKIKYDGISVTICRALVLSESVPLNKAAFYSSLYTS